jgi:DNA-nicking Smr family endonuclease
MTDNEFLPPAEPVEIPITNELDLHAFRADEVGSLLPEYFLECRKRNILAVRVVHGINCWCG